MSVDLPGAAHLVLADGVVHLDPEPAVFAAMLEGWARQQATRWLRDRTVQSRVRLVRRLAEFTNQYPWEWQAAEIEAFMTHLRHQDRPIVASTARGYLIDLRLFLRYATDARYGWPSVCHQRFGHAPALVIGDENLIPHVADYEGCPKRRPLTYDEIQRLFDAADGRAEQIRRKGRKGGLAAQRDAALLKVIYAFGLRRQEARGLDLADLRHNPKANQYGAYGAVFVRYGKASRGGQPKRRTVLTVPEMDWVVDVLRDWAEEIRLAYSPGNHPAMWLTERKDRMSLRSINAAFTTAREAAGLPEELDLHCLRHSYITHLIEFDYPEKFVQDQVGHAWGSTTAVYTGVSDEYRTRLVTRSLQRRHAELWEDEG